MPVEFVRKYKEKLRGKDAAELSKAGQRILLARLDPEYRRRFVLYTYRNHLRNRIRYDAPPDPSATIDITPSQIAYTIKRTDADDHLINKGLGQIHAGNWNTQEKRTNIADHEVICALERRFGDGVPWEETRYRKLVREWNGEKYQDQGFDSFESLFQQRCENYDELFEDINENGYESGKKGPHFGIVARQPVKSQLEVLVAIDSTGEIAFVDGHHRFAIARVLDIEIPAHVVWRHEHWQELRDEVYHNGLSGKHEERREHPDLQDIIG